jgi:hypothetical protein
MMLYDVVDSKGTLTARFPVPDYNGIHTAGACFGKWNSSRAGRERFNSDILIMVHPFTWEEARCH